MLIYSLESQCIGTLFLLLCTFIWQCSNINAIQAEDKGVRIPFPGYSICIYFLVIFCNTDQSNNRNIQSECGLIRNRITPNTDTFHAVCP